MSRIAAPARFRPVERRGRDLNPRRTQRPVTVFETAAFDRSATPPSRHRLATALDRRGAGFTPAPLKTAVPAAAKEGAHGGTMGSPVLSGEGGIRTLEGG